MPVYRGFFDPEDPEIFEPESEVLADQVACMARMKADVFDEVMEVLRPSVTIAREKVRDLLDRASRSETLYERVVYSRVASLLCEYALSRDEWLKVVDISERYLREFNSDHGYDADRGFDVTDV